MAESLLITGTSRSEKYESLLPQIIALTTGETDFVANLANVAGALRQTFGFFWVGFYLVKNDELVLGPFQGPVACTRIRKGKGVCGTAWNENRIVLVPDVEAFPGHIACSSESKSEIVVPLHNVSGTVIGVLDVDSDMLNDFDETDALFLGKLAQHITQFYERAAIA
ncbi:MAG: GAF domain-containing protein [Bacteroidia bacterium]